MSNATAEAERKRKLTEAGLCRQCPHPAKPCMPGHQLCEKHRKQANKARMHSYKLRKSSGKCVRPGCVNPANGTVTMCEGCAEKNREYFRNYARERSKKPNEPATTPSA